MVVAYLLFYNEALADCFGRVELVCVYCHLYIHVFVLKGKRV